MRVELRDSKNNLRDAVEIPAATLDVTFRAGALGLHLVKYIDARGRTVFNRLQMDDFLDDLQRLTAIDPTDDDLANMQRLFEHLPFAVDESLLDVARLRDRYRTPEVCRAIEQVRRLATRCRDEAGLLLMFEGS